MWRIVIHMFMNHLSTDLSTCIVDKYNNTLNNNVLYKQKSFISVDEA